MLEAGSWIGHDSLSLVASLRVYGSRVLLLGDLEIDHAFFRSARPCSEVGRAHHLLTVTGRWMPLPRTRTSRRTAFATMVSSGIFAAISHILAASLVPLSPLTPLSRMAALGRDGPDSGVGIHLHARVRNCWPVI